MKTLPALLTLSSILLTACAHPPPSAPSAIRASAPAPTPAPTAPLAATPADPSTAAAPSDPVPAAEEHDWSRCAMPARAYPAWCDDAKPRVQPKAVKP